jgi:nitroimidazol reductase NimA-like FMN-containing flavoprotein (pyridoxamine 5'-phosphate oxidase superfamily)
MPAKKRLPAKPQPKASRPHIPGYGVPKSRTGLLPWKWAESRLVKSRQYWIATTRDDGSPHVMLVWGLWLDGTFYFSTGRNSRKARNLAQNPRCVIGSDNSEEAVIVEGYVDTVNGREALEAIFAAYEEKYKMDVRGMGEPFYRLNPKVAFGLFEKKFAQTATRWKFALPQKYRGVLGSKL